MSNKKSKLSNKKAKRVINKKVVIFDSYFEVRRFDSLVLLERAGEISDLAIQPKFILQDGYSIYKNGKKSKRAVITYTADFHYIENGKVIVEDAKGHQTHAYKKSRSELLYRLATNTINSNSDILDFDIFREYMKDETVNWSKTCQK